MKVPVIVAQEIKLKEENSQITIHLPIISLYLSGKKGANKKRSIDLIPNIVEEWIFTQAARCMICWIEIKEGQSFETCPHCGAKAHRDHLAKWLSSRPINLQICPNCRAPLKL